MAKKSDHEKAFEAYPAALVLFTGPHTYVSGTWYAGNPKQASTWNYVTVHARGDVHFTNENELVNLLEKLSLHFENGNPDSSTVYKNLPADYREKLIKAIIGFEIEVAELDNVHKLSQNRDEKSYENIVAELKTQEGDAKTIAAMMEERKGRVFPQPKQS
jgi:transcriptional regulator